MPLKLTGPGVTDQLEQIAKDDTETAVAVSATDADGGTIRGELQSTGSWWTATAWYQWAKEKGRGYGAKIGVKF